MPKPRRIVVVAFPRAQTLDVAGPAEVFANAQRHHGVGYEVVVASSSGGPIAASSLVVDTVPLGRLRPGPRDTVLVAGGDEAGIRGALADEALLDWLRRAAPRVERMGSVCSGAFVLAALGLLDGRRAATHWSAVERLRAFRPAVRVDGAAIFVEDGLWTSAGVTTGIDMALALVERDHGARVAASVAAQLVLYVRRPGFQSQWSEALVAEREAADPLAATIARARANLRGATLASLARWAGLSERTFHRRCLAVLGVTPGRLLRKLRVEAAGALLRTTSRPHKQIAAACGFGSEEAMAAALRRELGLLPRELRMLHGH